MSARHWAWLCLSLVCCPAAFAGNPGLAGKPLLVYLPAVSDHDLPVLPYMRNEAETLLRAVGYTIEWRVRGAKSSGESAPDILVLDLVGPCGATTPPQAVAGPSAVLASTAVSGGTVLPFSRIDCTALNLVLARMLDRGDRTFLYGRAMGRLLAHELYHVLAQTQDHSRDGIGKRCFTVQDLVSDHFAFATTTLQRLRIPDEARTASPGAP